MNARSAGEGPNAACSRKRPACRSAPLPVPEGLEYDVNSTDALADLVVSAWLVAVTVTTWLAGMVAGAVYRPCAVIVPVVANQFTAVLDALLTAAVKGCEPESATVALAGETVTETGGGAATLTVIWIGVLVVAPFPGFVTVTGKVPALGRLPVALRLVGLI